MRKRYPLRIPFPYKYQISPPVLEEVMGFQQTVGNAGWIQFQDTGKVFIEYLDMVEVL